MLRFSPFPFMFVLACTLLASLVFIPALLASVHARTLR